jgi:hypothetical protein
MSSGMAWLLLGAAGAFHGAVPPFQGMVRRFKRKLLPMVRSSVLPQAEYSLKTWLAYLLFWSLSFILMFEGMVAARNLD